MDRTLKTHMKYRRRLEKRLRALEDKLQLQPVIVTLPDGNIRKISGRWGHTRRLLASALGSVELSPAEAIDRELIRTAVKIQEPSGCLLQLARAIMNSPDEA